MEYGRHRAFRGGIKVKGIGGFAIAGLLVLALTVVGTTGPGPKGVPPGQLKKLDQGELFCPRGALVSGSIVIQPGRCYVLFVLHDAGGIFLAFAAPNVGIPPGQLVRLNTPAGAKVRGRIFYLVPIRTTAVLVPVGTTTLVATKVEDLGPRLSITLVGMPAQNVTLIFTVRL